VRARLIRLPNSGRLHERGNSFGASPGARQSTWSRWDFQGRKARRPSTATSKAQIEEAAANPRSGEITR